MPIATIDDARDFIRDYVNRRNVSAEEKLDIFIQESYDELTQLDFAFWSQTVEVEIPKESWDEYCEEGRIPLWLIEASISAKTGKNYRIKKINDVWYKDEKIIIPIIKNQQGTQYYRVKIVNRSNQDGVFILRWEYLYRIYHRRYATPVPYFYDPKLDVLYRPYTLRVPFYVIPLRAGEERELWVFLEDWKMYGTSRWGNFLRVKRIENVDDNWRIISSQDFSPPADYLTNLRVPEFSSPILFRRYHLEGSFQFKRPKAIIFYLSHHYNQPQPQGVIVDRLTLSFLLSGEEMMKYVLGADGRDFLWKIGRRRGVDWDMTRFQRINFLPPNNQWFSQDFVCEHAHHLYFFPDQQKIITRVEFDDNRYTNAMGWGGVVYFLSIEDVAFLYEPDTVWNLFFYIFRRDVGGAEFSTRVFFVIDDVLDPFEVDVFFYKNNEWKLWSTFDWTQGNVPSAYNFPSVQEIQSTNWRKLEYKKVNENLRRRGGDFPVVWALEETTVRIPSLFLGYLAENVVENTIYDVGKAIELSPVPNVKNAVKLKIKGKIVPRFWQNEPRIWQDLIEILAEMTYIKVLRYLDEDELANQKFVVLMQRLAGYVVDSQSISTSSFQPLRFSDYTLSEEEMFNF
jgi:hypothetical protein